MPESSAVLVDGRGHSRTVAYLGMRCDGQQIPEALDGTKARLFRAPATFIGKAAPWNEGSPGAPNQVSYEGRSVAAIGGGRVYGILTPDMAADPSVWFSYPLRGLRVVENGNQGFLKKRPLSVQFGCDSWYVKMSEVFLIIPASGGRQTAGQEGTLLQALKA